MSGVQTANDRWRLMQTGHEPSLSLLNLHSKSVSYFHGLFSCQLLRYKSGVIAVAVLRDIVTKEKQFQDQENHDKLDADYQPQCTAESHLTETIVI